jgi:hypothetical protein
VRGLREGDSSLRSDGDRDRKKLGDQDFAEWPFGIVPDWVFGFSGIRNWLRRLPILKAQTKSRSSDLGPPRATGSCSAPLPPLTLRLCLAAPRPGRQLLQGLRHLTHRDRAALNSNL